MKLNKIVHKPIVTEKSAVDKDTFNRYQFKVHNKSSKRAIAQAVEDLFDVEVLDVKTMIMPGKKRRVGKTKRFITTSKWKKAVVTVQEGQEIKYD